MYRTYKVAIVVPAFNEEPHIAATLSGIPAFVDAVYVIDDASTDRTADIVRATRGFAGSGLRVAGGSPESPVGVGSHTDPVGLGGSGWGDGMPRPHIELLQHATNRGVGAAIVTGYKRALAGDMDIVAVMAGDNQMEPQYLSAVLDPVVEGRADYSKGTRLTDPTHQSGMSAWRRVGNFTLRWLTVIASGNPVVTDPQQGYAAISREALQGLDLDAVYPYYGYCNDLIVRLSAQAWRIAEIPMPSMYHGEVSKIRYQEYIPKVSWLLLRLFVWRITGRLCAREAARRPVSAEPVEELRT
jgi:glycosyltransferase involved in cell wall biosynthesis